MTQQELEMRIISHITHSEEDVNLLLSEGIDSGFFFHGDLLALRSLAERAMRYYVLSSHLLTLEALELDLKRDASVPDPVKKNLTTLFSRCLAISVDSNTLPSLLRELRENAVSKLLTDSVTNLQQLMKVHPPTRVLDEMQRFYADAVTGLMAKDGQTKIFDVDAEFAQIWDGYVYRRDHKEDLRGVCVGLRVLDEATFGFQPGTLNTVVGEVGKGKSTILLNWAAAAHNRGKNVLFISFEMPLWQVQARYVAMSLQVPYGDFMHGSLKEEDEAKLRSFFEQVGGERTFEDIQASSKSYFKIIDEPNDKTVRFVDSMIRRYRVAGKPHAAFVDYVSIMKSEGQGRNADFWQTSGWCAGGLRDLARIHEMAMFTAQQINRKGLEANRKGFESGGDDVQIHSEHVAEDKRLVNDSDSVLGFYPTENRIHFQKIKGRDFNFENFTVDYLPSMCCIQDSTADPVLDLAIPANSYIGAYFNELGKEAEVAQDEFDKSLADMGNEDW